MVFRCPLTFITDFSWTMIKTYGFYEKGFLPNGKGWGEETNKFIQAMMVLENEFNKQKNKVIENGRSNTRSSNKSHR